MTYWPGTDTPKSTGNAFDWKIDPSVVATDKVFKASVAAKRNAQMQKTRQFTIYSKAVPK